MIIHHRLTRGAGNQCCYNESGRLVVGPPGGGTLDLFSPSENQVGHIIVDVIPYLWCCTGPFKNCDNYYRQRPSDSGSRFQRQPPGEASLQGKSVVHMLQMYYLLQDVCTVILI